MSKKGDICKYCGKGVLSLWGDCSSCPRVTMTLIPVEKIDLKPLEVPNFKIFDLVWKDILSYNKCDCGAEKANTTHSGWCSINV